MNQLATMALSLALGVAFVATPYNTASPSTASFHTTGAVDSPGTFSAFAVGPGLNDLSVKNDYTFYQWTLRNDDQVQRIERKLDTKTVDPVINTGENGVDSISLSPLGLNNPKVLTTDAVEGIDTSIQPAWEFHNQLGARRPVVVAVIDTGTNTTHPDLKDSMWVNEDKMPSDGIDNNGNGYIDDINGWNFLDNTGQLYVGKEDSHGARAAGTITTSRSNGDITGINDGQYVKIVFLKALDDESGKGSPKNVIAAIRHVEASGAQIYNLSFDSENYTEELMTVIQNSRILFAVTAGNGDENERGYSIDQYPVYPANPPFDSVITMANLMFDDKPDRSSNYGPVSVDPAAPSCFILSTIPSRSRAFMIGISMATPMVTGAATAIYSARPDLDLVGVKSVLLASTERLDTLSGRVSSEGMLDVYLTLQ